MKLLRKVYKFTLFTIERAKLSTPWWYIQYFFYNLILFSYGISFQILFLILILGIKYYIDVLLLLLRSVVMHAFCKEQFNWLSDIWHYDVKKLLLLVTRLQICCMFVSKFQSLAQKSHSWIEFTAINQSSYRQKVEIMLVCNVEHSSQVLWSIFNLEPCP